ncbi:MAG: hypothetical protein IT244_12155 [Bacteroidia bacterium]|nr:hypothetical protein [Bacteroidia bacterium]
MKYFYSILLLVISQTECFSQKSITIYQDSLNFVEISPKDEFIQVQCTMFGKMCRMEIGPDYIHSQNSILTFHMDYEDINRNYFIAPATYYNDNGIRKDTIPVDFKIKTPKISSDSSVQIALGANMITVDHDFISILYNNWYLQSINENIALSALIHHKSDKINFIVIQPAFNDSNSNLFVIWVNVKVGVRMSSAKIRIECQNPYNTKRKVHNLKIHKRKGKRTKVYF